MTKTTATRQLRETLRAVLGAHKIDDLQLECDLASAVGTFFAEVKRGRDPAVVRAEIEKAFWTGIIDTGAKMRERIMKALNINISEHPSWPGVVEFCKEKDELGQTIEKFAEYCHANPFSMPKPFQIVQKPTLIRDTWPQAFVKVEAVQKVGMPSFVNGRLVE